MTNKERLVELLGNATFATYTYGDGAFWKKETTLFNEYDSDEVENIADYLSNAGVIVPKFKVGQDVWINDNIGSHRQKPLRGNIHGILIYAHGLTYQVDYGAGFTQVGRIVAYLGDERIFATKAQAEAALKGGGV